MLIKIRNISEIKFNGDKGCITRCDIQLLTLWYINDKMTSTSYIIKDVQVKIPKTLGDIKTDDLLEAGTEYNLSGGFIVDKILEKGFEEKIKTTLETISTLEIISTKRKDGG